MANVLTDLAADIYKAADIVGREMVGFIPSATVNGDGADRVAKGDKVRSHFTREPTVDTSFSPSMTIPEGTDQTVDNKYLTLNQFASVKIPWSGEDMRHVNNGSGFETVYGDQVLQAIRKIANLVEAYTFSVAYKSASRAVGVAGTTPFSSNHDLLAEARQVLVDNGCPMDNSVTLVMNTAAGTKMRNLTQLQKANEAGGSELLRQGTLLDLQGLMIKESAGISAHTKGTGTLYDINNGAGEAVGQTVITLDGGTAGVTGIVAGDVVTFAGDTTNKYIVNTGLAGAAGDIVLNKPGLRVAAADATEMTIGNTYTPNVAFHRGAIEVAFRAPEMPNGGDAAIDTLMVQDTWSGLTFEIAAYKGYMKSMFDVRCLYDAIAWKEEHIMVVMG